MCALTLTPLSARLEQRHQGARAPIALGVGLVVLLVVGDQVGQREADVRPNP